MKKSKHTESHGHKAGVSERGSLTEEPRTPEGQRVYYKQVNKETGFMVYGQVKV